MIQLTPREIDAVRTYAEVGDVGMAAARLGIAHPTMRNLLTRARKRAGVRSTVQLVYLLSREGRLHD